MKSLSNVLNVTLPLLSPVIWLPTLTTTRFPRIGTLNVHTKYIKITQDSVRAMDLWDQGEGLLCGMKFKISILLDYHVSACHTENGQWKHRTESQMAAYFTQNGISFTQDRQILWNLLHARTSKTCSRLRPRRIRADFFLRDISTTLGCYIVVGNDEFAHRKYRYT